MKAAREFFPVDVKSVVYILPEESDFRYSDAAAIFSQRQELATFSGPLGDDFSREYVDFLNAKFSRKS